MIFSLKLNEKQFSMLEFAHGHHLKTLIDHANLYSTYVKDKILKKFRLWILNSTWLEIRLN